MKNMMEFCYKALLIFGLLGLSTSTMARDDLLSFDFDEVLQRGYSEGILDENITFKLVGQKHKAVIKKFSNYRTNKKTRRLGKPEVESCAWALLTALKTLQARAHSLNANAIINIKSNYKNREFSSSTEYQCGSGFIMAGVALKADVVNL